ncbi:hypothetical protein [Pseudobacillus wudalianchiensis]|uniref:Transcriptional regulator n=1 Tax=Pseudobacillus wudalianchiensis TaxID=1743143 RepID=A0A1B9AE49_9BACI|nr:hypothetical protein [Bacillus wudalianchiensis]OCA82091.1 hypothetical protein A8F95_15440 [Bacillus wudalianchiensis]
MYRIGVVGPSSSIKRILELANEIEQEMEFISYPYTEVEEVKGIVSEYYHQVDFWIFSGYIPYQVAEKILPSNENVVYIFSTESSIYKSFMELAYSQRKLLDRISIDMFPATNVTEGESLQQLKKMVKEFYVKDFDADISSKDLFTFHYDLWKQKKIEGALTCYPTVHEALNKAGVPAFLMSPTRVEIFQTLRIFFEKIRASYYKDTQIGVEKIEVKDFDAIKEKVEKTYEVQYLELKIKETLLQLCENLDGSLVEEGNGRYTIFSSRGAIEREIQKLREKVQYLSLEADAVVSVGIGFGKTVLSAEINAHRALQESKRKEEQEIMIVQDDGTIIESAGQEEELTYAYRTEDKEFLETLKKAKINVKTFKKIDALIKKMGWSNFTTKDLAMNLQMTERNAQRIVAELCDAGLAECIGEESHQNRGRPIKVYCLK